MNKWLSSLQDTPKPMQYQPKLLNMEPAYGFEGTIVTLVLQELSCPTIKLAFNSLVVETKQLQSQGMTSLVATVPSFEMTLSTSSIVPISICFLEKDMIQDTIFIANFTYQSNNTIANTTNNDPNSEMIQRGRKRSIVSFMNDISNPNKRVYQGMTEDAFSNYLPSNNTYNSMPLSSYPYYQQRDNSSSNSTIKHDYYSTTSSASSSPLSSPQLSTQPSSYYPSQSQSSTTTHTRKSYHRPTVHSLKSTSHQPSTSVANYQPYPGLVSQNNLVLVNDLDTMMQHWTPEECQQGRRLVRFWRQDNAAEDDVIRCHCEPIAQQDPAATDTNNTVVSCIYCPDRNDYFITSVDCIYLLESLMNTHFGVEEKNRIRRNLEGFRPITVAKCKPKSADFFKLVMSFPHPKPRNIEKDIKAFTWKILPYALKKIIMKYTVTSSSTSSSSSLGRLLPSPSSSPASTNIINNNNNNNNSNNNNNDNNINNNNNNNNQYQSNIMNCLSSKKYPIHPYESSSSSSSLPPTSLTTSSSSTTTTSISSLISSTSTSSSSSSFSSFPTPPSMINEDIHPQSIASTDKQQYYYHPSSTNPPVYGLPPPPSSALPLQDRSSYLPTSSSSPVLSVSSPQLAYIPHSSSTPTTSTFMDDINNPITPTTTSFPINSTTTTPYPSHTSSSSSSSSSMILPPPSNNFMSQLTIDGVSPYDSNILTSYIS